MYQHCWRQLCCYSDQSYFFQIIFIKIKIFFKNANFLKRTFEFFIFIFIMLNGLKNKFEAFSDGGM